MTTGTPYIGSKISLISKAEIRYEGILYDVNSKEATVTLSKVRSYGTEDRPAPKPIQPRNEVYEYIIFRGSDIKDLSVNEMAKQDEGPQDPAIVSTQTLPPPTSRQQPPQAPHGPTTGSIATGQPAVLPPGPTSGYTPFPPGLGTYNPFMPYFGRPPMMMGQPPLIPATQHPHHHPPPPQHISSSQPPPPLTQSDPTATKPSPLTSAGPPSESTPPSVAAISLETSTPINNDGPSIPLPSTVSSLEQSDKVSKDLTTSASNELTEQGRLSERQTLFNNEDTEPQLPPDTTTNEMNSKPRSPTTNQKGQSSSSTTYRNRRTPQRVNYQSGPPRGSRGNYRREGRAGSSASSYNRSPRGGSGHYPSSNGRGQGSSGATHQQPLRYDSEFDFDSANARFSKEQLEDEIKKKLKISDERSSADSTPDETPPQERPEEELEEGEYHEEDDIPEEVVTEENSAECYDRSKSFFDNISCEANNSSNRRPNRSEERALNTETFGVTSRGYRGRPRGGRGNRGRGYYPRGGNDWGYYDNYRYGGYQSRGRNYSGRGGGYYSGGSGYYGGGSYKGRGSGYQDRRTYPRNQQQQSDYQS